MKQLHTLGILAAGLLTSAPGLHAVTLYGLTSANELIRFDSATPGSITTIGTISAPGIVDIDVYPANGLLYAFNSTGAGFTLNLTNAVATQVITAGAGLLGTLTDADFNPSADRIRIYTSGGAAENFRMAPDFTTNNPGTSGAIIADGNFSDAAAVLVASAYNNNFDSQGGLTTLYSIDTTSNSLVSHSVGPAFNTVTTVGTGLGVAVGSNVGLDILGTDGIAYLSDGQLLYTVNLGTGLASSLGTVGGSGLVSIAVPEPTTIALASLGLITLAARRRRSATTA